MSNNNIVYLEVCYGNIDSICIRATKKLSKADAQYYTINDALKLGFEIKHEYGADVEIETETNIRFTY